MSVTMQYIHTYTMSILHKFMTKRSSSDTIVCVGSPLQGVVVLDSDSLVVVKSNLEIANKAKEQLVQTWVERILETIKSESEKGKTEARLWLNDYDEFYGNTDFNIIVSQIQSKLYKHDVQVIGDWSTLNEGLYIHIRWDKRWKSYWFFGKRRCYK